MTWYETSVIVLLILAVIRSLFNLVVAIANIHWLNGNAIQEDKLEKIKPDKKLFLLLPVYLEQDLITETIQYYHQIISKLGNVYLVLITTQKEEVELEAESSSTRILAEQTIRKLNATERVLIIHYPHTFGSMPDQLNYAAQEIVKTHGVVGNWFFTLNIDSRFQEAAFKAVVKMLNVDDKRICQFSAFFLSNYNKLNSYFLRASALFQSRWTIVHELKRYRRNASNWKSLQKYQLAHAVGHGLLIPVEVFDRYRFPVDEVIEDSPFGYLLRCEGYVIHPMKHIELADSPCTLLDHFRQKYTWSFGPMGYFNYFRKYKQAFAHSYQQNRSKVWAITTQGVGSAINWQVSSWVFWYLIVATVILPAQFSLVIVTGMMIYTLDYAVCAYHFLKKGYVKPSPREWLLLFLANWLVILTHSFPANWALITKVLKKLGIKQSITKFKTRHE